MNGHQYQLPEGAVVIAAITSCTNTSNPSVLMVRVSPEIHRLSEAAAKATGKSLNTFAAEALERAAKETIHP